MNTLQYYIFPVLIGLVLGPIMQSKIAVFNRNAILTENEEGNEGEYSYLEHYRIQHAILTFYYSPFQRLAQLRLNELPSGPAPPTNLCIALSFEDLATLLPRSGFIMRFARIVAAAGTSTH